MRKREEEEEGREGRAEERGRTHRTREWVLIDCLQEGEDGCSRHLSLLLHMIKNLRKENYVITRQSCTCKCPKVTIIILVCWMATMRYMYM